MKIPFIDLKPLTARVRDSALQDWSAALDNTSFIGGPEVMSLEKELSAELGPRHVVACANGTDALILALQAAGVKRGMKVGVPNLTFWATVEAVVNLGADPVLIDCDESLQLDVDELQHAHKSIGLNAVLTAHLMGWASPRIGELRAFCESAEIPLIEDGAQSYGVLVDGESIYKGARFSTLSFYPAKVIGGVMDGGAVLLQHAEREALVRSLANHGRAQHYSYAHVGWNSRMGSLQGSFLRRVVAMSENILSERRRLLERYAVLLGAGLKGLKLWLPPPTVEGNGYLAVCTHEVLNGEFIASRLKERGVHCGRVYPETMDMQPPIQNAGRVSSLARSRAFTEAVFNLPLYYGMTEADQVEVVRALSECL